MADPKAAAILEHLSKEFEKLHDAFPGLVVRTALLEEWQRSHPDSHRLEGIALGIAKQATDLRLESMNELRKQIDNERGSFITRELYDREHVRLREEMNSLRESRDNSRGEKNVFEQLLPVLGAIAMFLVGALMAHFWK